MSRFSTVLADIANAAVARDFYIYILDDMIENVSVSVPALSPLFRSDQQLRSILVQTVGVLGHLGEALREVQGVDCAFVFVVACWVVL
ncbi:MAG: hypothetical protein F4X48_04595 [Acidimicrobiia bacterium]|nr:hypothetical protein [Acidimicrobiia bacterium]MYC57851.1 hypothetical protein [Acidimicrobiia bacterium]